MMKWTVRCVSFMVVLCAGLLIPRGQIRSEANAGDSELSRKVASTQSGRRMANRVSSNEKTRRSGDGQNSRVEIPEKALKWLPSLCRGSDFRLSKRWRRALLINNEVGRSISSIIERNATEIFEKQRGAPGNIKLSMGQAYLINPLGAEVIKESLVGISARIRDANFLEDDKLKILEIALGEQFNRNFGEAIELSIVPSGNVALEDFVVRRNRFGGLNAYLKVRPENGDSKLLTLPLHSRSNYSFLEIDISETD